MKEKGSGVPTGLRVCARRGVVCLLTALTALICAPARAAADAQDPQAATPEVVDVGDLLRMVRHVNNSSDGDLSPASDKADKPYIVVAPSIGSKPSTGLTGGLSGNMAFFRGDPATTHISSVTAGLKVSQKGQTLSGSKLAMFTADDKWFILGDNRLSWTSANAYAFGTDTLAHTATNVKYDALRLYETAYRRVDKRLFVGVGVNISDHSNVQPGSSSEAAFDQSAYSDYTQKHGLPLDGQTSSGTSLALLYDSRDNGINPQHGVLLNTTYRTFFSGFLGGDSTWQGLSIDARTYRPLTSDGRQKLAFWFLGDLVTGGTAPYFDLPSTASDGRSARGYGEGRYRGERLVYGEVEYRNTLTENGLLGFVAFVNTTTVDSVETGEKLFGSFAPGAGFGFRFLLNKRSKTNLCTDYAWGKQGSRGFYLAIQEAF
jgi:Omp85 superfamily domain